MSFTVSLNCRWVVAASILVATMLTILPSTSAIQCYQCNSVKDPNCQDLKANATASLKYLQECDVPTAPPNSTFCRKIVQTILAEGESRVIRKCGYERSTKPCYHVDDEAHAEVVCQCFEEACNGAAGYTLGRTLTAISSSVVLLFLAR